MNENRGIFTFQGIPGMLIATVLLLSILGVLTYLGILAQQDAMQNPYQFDREQLSKVKKFESTAVEAQIMK